MRRRQANVEAKEDVGLERKENPYKLSKPGTRANPVSRKVSQTQHCWHFGTENSLLWGLFHNIIGSVSSISGLYLLDASSTYPPVWGLQKSLHTLSKVLQVVRMAKLKKLPPPLFLPYLRDFPSQMVRKTCDFLPQLHFTLPGTGPKPHPFIYLHQASPSPVFLWPDGTQALQGTFHRNDMVFQAESILYPRLRMIQARFMGEPPGSCPELQSIGATQMLLAWNK